MEFTYFVFTRIPGELPYTIQVSVIVSLVIRVTSAKSFISLCGFSIQSYGNRDGLLGVCRTRDRKVAISNPDRSGGRIFFSRVNSVW